MICTTGRLGMDIGGTKAALRIEADGAEPAQTAFTWSGADVHADMAELAAALDRLCAGRPGPPGTAGVAVPATLDAEGRVTAWPGRPTWTGFDLTAALRDLLPGTDVRCADDGDLAALAEARAAGCDHLVYLGVGTGVGGGVVLDGQPRPGPGRGSCEVGHMVVDRGGPRCDCGRYGCLQASASGPAVLRRAGRGAGAVTFPELRAGWLAGEVWAVAAVDEACAALAAAVVSLDELMHPELTVVGGGFADGLPGFVTLVERHVGRHARRGHRPAPLAEARLGGLSSLSGALLLAREPGGTGGADRTRESGRARAGTV
ncbi:ROK family protein [Streptomyces aculeolatus]